VGGVWPTGLIYRGVWPTALIYRGVWPTGLIYRGVWPTGLIHWPTGRHMSQGLALWLTRGLRGAVGHNTYQTS